MIQSFILIFVAACLTLGEAQDLQEINCKDKEGHLCSRYDYHDPQEIADRAQQVVYIAVGVTLAALVVIVVIIISCLFCAGCPGYKLRRNRGNVLASTAAQRQPVTFYQQPPYNPQQINAQPPLQHPYPGFVYSSGQTMPQTFNAPYNSPITENKENPWTGHNAGAPGVPPAYYQTSPQDQNMTANFTSH